MQHLAMRHLIIPLVLASAACDDKPPIEQRATPVNAAAAAAPASPIKPSVEDPGLPTGTPGTPSGLPDDRTPLEEPRGPIDPKSAEGAGQVVQRFAALIEEGKFAEAYKAWGAGIELGELAPERLKALGDVHLEVGKPYDQEGAAGSIFIMVPLRLYGTGKDGKGFNFIGPVTLRRVNDVDGASAAQLRWHIVESALVAKR